jgi:phosphohistidine phosphatase SixA
LLVGHNPGMEDLLHVLTGQAEAMPTAALAQIALPLLHWRGLSAGVRGSLVAVWRPRELDDHHLEGS